MKPLLFHIDNGLRRVLKSIAYNVPNDWDSIILISGSGMVRVGKSILAQQVGCFLANQLGTKWDVTNILFTGKELIEKARTYPKNSVFVYDEGRGELDTKKVMEEITKALMDFFAECGMYNHIIIIVLPDYFDLPKGLAINRSELLLNVYRDRATKIDEEGEEIIEFKRGFFQGFHRKSKKKLYMLGKKNFNDYDAAKRDFFGDFPNTYTVDKDKYLAKKLEYLSRERVKEPKSVVDNRLNIVLRALCNHVSALQAEKELKSLGFSVSNDTILNRIKKIPKELTNY